MTNKPVAFATMKAAEGVGTVVRRGRVGPMLIGMVVGSAAGALLAFVTIYLLIPGIAFGAIIGITVAGAIFRSPPQALGTDPSGEQPQSLGVVGEYWTCPYEQQALTVAALMDRAIFLMQCDAGLDLSGVFAQLNSGQRPDFEVSHLILLSNLKWIEWQDGDDLVLFWYAPRSNPKKTRCGGMKFTSTSDREKFLAAAAARRGVPWLRAAGSWSMMRSALVPAVMFVLVLLGVIGLTVLTASWATAPPQPAAAQPRQEGVADLLIRLGPMGVLLLGLLPIAAALAWLAHSVLRPPKVHFVSAVPVAELRGLRIADV